MNIEFEVILVFGIFDSFLRPHYEGSFMKIFAVLYLGNVTFLHLICSFVRVNSFRGKHVGCYQ